VKLHFFSDVVLQLLTLIQGFLVWPWEVVHDVGEGVVDLQMEEAQEGSGAWMEPPAPSLKAMLSHQRQGVTQSQGASLDCLSMSDTRALSTTRMPTMAMGERKKLM